MKKARIYINEIRSKHYSDNVSNACDEHNLRLTETADYIPELSQNNSYLREKANGDLVPVPYSKKNMKELKRYIDKIAEQEVKDFYKATTLDEARTQEKRNQLSNRQAKLKKKLTNWIENPKTSEEEREIFAKVLIDIEDKRPFNKQNQDDFKAITAKVLRRNDKLKAIQDASDLNEWNLAQKRTGLERKVKNVEVLFKIPDQWNVNIQPDQWQRLAKAFKKKFPNNRLLYSAVHMDENEENPHLHFKMSGYNKKTNDYDYPDQCMELLKQKHGKDYPFGNKKWCELNKDELKQHGEMMQDYYFNYMNNFLKQLLKEQHLKERVVLAKRTEQEKKKDNHDYSAAKKPISKRENSRQNKLKKENEEQQKKLNKVKKQRNKEQMRIKILENKASNIEDKIKENDELKEKIQSDFYKLLKIPKMIIQSFKNLIDIYRSDDPEVAQDAQAAAENERFKNEFEENLEGFNMEDEAIKNEISNTIEETSNLIEEIQEGTEAELLAMEQTEKNTKKLKTITL